MPLGDVLHTVLFYTYKENKMKNDIVNNISWTVVGIVIGFALAIIGIGYGFVTITGAAGCI
jgi:hypothetical protein